MAHRLLWLGGVRWALLVATIAGCTSTQLEIAYEDETVPEDDPSLLLPIGRGLLDRVTVWSVRDSFGDEEPETTAYAPDQLELAVDGGTQVDACPLCVVATGADITITATTPNGRARATRRVASEVKLSTYALMGTPVDAIQLPADSHPQLSLLFREQGGGKVSGHAAGFTGLPIDPDTSTVTTGAPGDTTLAAVDQPAIAPLAVRVIDPATSVATIAQLTADSGATSLTVYTQDFDSRSFVLEAFDADGYLALPGLSVAATGPNLAPANLSGGACDTDDFCFLHPSLPDGTNELDTFVELVAGSADQRIPVTIIRGSH